MKNWNDTPFASLVYQDALTDMERHLLSIVYEHIDRTIQDLHGKHSTGDSTAEHLVKGKMVNDVMGEICVNTEALGFSPNEFEAEAAMASFASITVFRRQPRSKGGGIKVQWTKTFTECSCPMDMGPITHLYFRVNPDIIDTLLKDAA